VRKIEQPASKGLKSFEWNLRYESTAAVRSSNVRTGAGDLVLPGEYSITMYLNHNGDVKQIGEEQIIKVKALQNVTLPAVDRQAKVAFQEEVAEAYRQIQAAQSILREVRNELELMENALKITSVSPDLYRDDFAAMEEKLDAIGRKLNGDPEASKLDIDTEPSISSRVSRVRWEEGNSTSAPTGTHREQIQIAMKQFEPIKKQLNSLIGETIPEMRRKLNEWQAPYTPSRVID
jgi:uncharacterized protein YukE